MRLDAALLLQRQTPVEDRQQGVRQCTQDVELQPQKLMLTNCLARQTMEGTTNNYTMIGNESIQEWDSNQCQTDL